MKYYGLGMQPALTWNFDLLVLSLTSGVHLIKGDEDAIDFLFGSPADARLEDYFLAIPRQSKDVCC